MYSKKINYLQSSSFSGPTFRPTPGRGDPISGGATERDVHLSASYEIAARRRRPRR
jgi:hypothetical protein